MIGERWASSEGIPHRLPFCPISGELVLERWHPDDLIQSVDVLDLPVVIGRGPVFLLDRRAPAAGRAWSQWRRRQTLCRGVLQGWRAAMERDRSLDWLLERLSELPRG